MENKTHTNFGIHYMLDGYGADFDILNSRESIQKILEELPTKMDMHTICDTVIAEVGPNNKKDPGGISGFVMIAESHISIHTFPGRGFVSIDVYTCNDSIDKEKLTAEFTEYFKLKEVEEHLVKRGTKYPAENIF